jgi:hypothetical protein
MLSEVEIIHLISFVFKGSMFVHFILCYLIVGPIVLKLNGTRKLYENYLYIGNIIHMGYDLKALAEKGNLSAINTVKVMKVTKWVSIASVILMISLSLFFIFTD